MLLRNAKDVDYYLPASLINPNNAFMQTEVKNAV